ncbi:molecular chaperone DjiA [Antarcticibacterium flavum]|uniref:Molecular chaperone DjiA n=1 Tax=Antarcticibacterium flavum TaxID=2058175 RepID=A0A5B7X245_9FLAO|nr:MULTISPECIES: TerB family tellurite resistance protein [Antarcticibacterium]MCM4159073.1 molecular chaperone DjlA [Antarcticibacterium sp. W02-3]QCY69477.1 molecular chaperone DjiA [Antarcticibacterium flavum]
MFKWILAIIGFMFFRYAGAVLGFILGTVIDNWSRSSTSFQAGYGREGQKVSPGDFELNLLSLASIVIKADGKVSQTELDYVRAYFVQAYGKERANATFRTFNDVIKNREISAQRIGLYLQQRTRYEVRLQIIHFLFSIAKADGQVSQAELNQLREISGFLNLMKRDFESIKAMFFKSADNAYKILEIEKSATDAEVKKAFRTMAKKYHPDKLQHMDEAYRKGAEEKFRKVQEAYEHIQKERGI